MSGVPSVLAFMCAVHFAELSIAHTESGNVPPKDTALPKAAPAAAPPAAAAPAVASKLSGLSVADVAALLDSLGMKKYAPKFAEFAIDGLTLVECEDADLIECGVDFKPVRRGCCWWWSACRLLSYARRVGLLLADSTACACVPVSAPLEAAQARRGAGGRGSCGAHGRPPPPHSNDVGLCQSEQR